MDIFNNMGYIYLLEDKRKGKTGRKHSSETKQKISDKKIGTKNPKHSEFMKHNNPKSKKVSIDGIIYESIEKASKNLNLARHLVKNRLKSKKYDNWYKL